MIRSNFGIGLRRRLSVIIGYNNVSFETFTAGFWSSFVPVQSVHVTLIGRHSAEMFIYAPLLSGIQLYSAVAWSGNIGGGTGWRTIGTPLIDYQFLSRGDLYPSGNAWGQSFTPASWNPSGNTGFKTIAEWQALQTDVTNNTKRNLVGTPVFEG